MTKIAILLEQLHSLNIQKGDTLLVRAALKDIELPKDESINFLDILLDTVGKNGTIVSLSFTKSTTLLKPNKQHYFHIKSPTYAGALPQAMLNHPNSYRSLHPMCSFVAIGKSAKYITENHCDISPAYDPMNKLIELNGKGVLIGCVKSSPGFTTAHLAEYNLNMHKLVIFPKLTQCYYQDFSGNIKLFQRPDLGLCSNSYYKFYAHYVREGILQSGKVGNAYSICVPLKEAYDIEYKLLKENNAFNICDDKLCVTCNLRRWDRLYRWPLFFAELIKTKILKLRKDE
jgi:aminoglycoside N3'-acetyltransferase